MGTEVVVSSEQAAVQTESVELKNSVDRRQIMDLPLATRNPLDLVRTMPGIVTPTASPIADAFVHGLRGNSTNITQDGINVADNYVKTGSFFAISAPTVDTVGEFNVSIGGIGVDAGFGAAQVNIRTACGSNDFHGSAFWFQRSNALNANTWFNNAAGVARPFQLQNRVGVNAGGPVYIPKAYDGRNRTWVFGQYEAFREPVSRSRTRTVLTPAVRLGQFTYTPAAGGAAQTVNLLGLGTVGSSTAAPAINKAVMDYYNSLVPADGLTDSACANGDGVNIRSYTFNLPGKGAQNRYTVRADHQLTKSHSIEFVFNQADFDLNPDLILVPNFPKSPGGSQTSRRQVVTWAFNSIFGTAGAFSLTSNPAPTAPTASFPVSQRNNFTISNASNLWYFSKDLATPYLLEWSFSIQREIMKRMTLETRYVGNHAVRQHRSWSINELDFQNNGLLGEFLNAQKNLALGGNTSFANQGRAGQVALPIFDKLFAGRTSASSSARRCLPSARRSTWSSGWSSTRSTIPTLSG